MFRRAVFAFLILLLPGSTRASSHADGGIAPKSQAKDAGVKAASKNSGTRLATKDDRRKTAGKDSNSRSLTRDSLGRQQGKVVGKRKKKLSRYAAIELFHVNTKETLKLRFQDDNGRPIKSWKKRFDKFMRCHQTGTVFNMDQRLAHMLYQVSRHYDGQRLEVISGFRHPKVAKNPKSPHKQGVACDFRVVGVSNSALRDYLRKTFDHAGVGYYPNSVFVHLDDRKKGPSAFWIDYAGPGQAASYAENPREDLRTGRAERRRSSGGADGRAEGADDFAQAGLAVPAIPGSDAQGKPRQATTSAPAGNGSIAVTRPIVGEKAAAANVPSVAVKASLPTPTSVASKAPGLNPTPTASKVPVAGNSPGMNKPSVASIAQSANKASAGGKPASGTNPPAGTLPPSGNKPLPR